MLTLNPKPNVACETGGSQLCPDHSFYVPDLHSFDRYLRSIDSFDLLWLVYQWSGFEALSLLHLSLCRHSLCGYRSVCRPLQERTPYPATSPEGLERNTFVACMRLGLLIHQTCRPDPEHVLISSTLFLSSISNTLLSEYHTSLRGIADGRERSTAGATAGCPEDREYGALFVWLITFRRGVERSMIISV